MPRNIPEAPVWSPPERGQTELTLNLKLITPMFGGGYEPREVDPITPIRAAAIRGHLRFWWRATVGAQYPTAQELFKAESALWGSSALEVNGKQVGGPGRVQLAVRVTAKGEKKPHSQLAPVSLPKTGPREGVFLFPFQKQQGENPAPEAWGRKGVRWELEVRCAESDLSQVRTALRAWIAFGGVGSRTRRGCGAFTVASDQAEWLPPGDRGALRSWLQGLARERGGPSTHSVLARAQLVIGQPGPDVGRVWSDLGRFWCAVRKGHVGSKEYTPMAGARWQDYRGALETFRRRPGDRINLAKPFLGLPIIYQKFEEGAKPALYTPTIESESTGRMASPVILKPLALSNGQFAPLVLVLNAPKPRRIRIAQTAVDLSVPQGDPVLRDLGASDPLEAVLKAAERHFRTTRISVGGQP